ncbi:MAG: transporter [Legionellales bacterium]|nr:transporter [Legionellales bacterium]
MKNTLRLQLIKAGILSLLAGISLSTFASGFQLLEESAAGTGDYQSGGAALANDASTGFYNPAGLVRLKHQELNLGVAGIITDIQFTGQASTNLGYSATGTAQAGNANAIPNFHYAAPLSDRVGFGFDVTVPFGLETAWKEDSIVRYSNTLTSVKTVDISPSLGFALTKQLSVGAGWDAQYMNVQFNQVAGVGPTNVVDTTSRNKGKNWGNGWHAGVLYQFTPQTRMGISYRSKVVHHLKGTSYFWGLLALNVPPVDQFNSNTLTADITLPATTTISFYHDMNDRWAILGSAYYTQWDVIKRLVLVNVAGLDQNFNLNTLTAGVDAYYRNTWNFSLGTHYKLTDKITAKLGVGYDKAPIKTLYRNLRLPDSNRIAVAVGAHFQPSEALGIDVGWTHLFLQNAPVNNQASVGPSTTTVIGNVKSHADVLGAELSWKFL